MKKKKKSKFTIGRVANRLTNDFFLSKDYKNLFIYLFCREATLS